MKMPKNVVLSKSINREKVIEPSIANNEKNIECPPLMFIEDQAICASYEFAPRSPLPSPSPPPPVSKLDRRRDTGRRRKRDSLLTGKGEEVPNNKTARKPGPL
jgi:hypothetical protein